jgi:Zn-dependent metalloprotease
VLVEKFSNCDDDTKKSEMPIREHGKQKNVASSTAIAKVLNTENLALSRFDDVTLTRDPDMGTPHFIGRRTGFLSPPAPRARMKDVLATFLKANGHEMTLAMSDLEGENAKIKTDYTTRHNGMRHVLWQQTHGGLDIFGATLTLNLTKKNEIVNLSSRALHIPSVRFHGDVKLTEEDALEIVNAVAKVEDFRNSQMTFYPLDMISVVKAWDLTLEIKRTPTEQTSPDANTNLSTPPLSEMRRLIVRTDTGEVVEDISLTWNAVASTGTCTVTDE